MRTVLRQSAPAGVQVIVATDNEAILGLGDLGAGGMPIAVGKSILYCVGAGIHPRRVLPVSLDVGTDNQSLIDDPLYLGVRHRRLRGDEYASLLDEFVEAVRAEYPRALLQWEDFASRNAFQVLQRYRKVIPSFDDDVQGTGAVIVAGIQAGLRRAGRRLDDERVVFYGAGASGAGCALAVRAAMAADGVPPSELSRRVLCLDSRGLILADRPGLEGEKREIAADPAVASGWGSERGRIGLEEVVRRFRPGTARRRLGPAGRLHRVDRPRHGGRLPASDHPPDLQPDQQVRGDPGGRHLLDERRRDRRDRQSLSSRFEGAAYQIGQGNNAFIFPGVGLGAIAVEARWLPDAAFAAAGEALSAEAPAPGPIYPPLVRLRESRPSWQPPSPARWSCEGGAEPSRTGRSRAHPRSLVWEPENSVSSVSRRPPRGARRLMDDALAGPPAPFRLHDHVPLPLPAAHDGARAPHRDLEDLDLRPGTPPITTPRASGRRSSRSTSPWAS